MRTIWMPLVLASLTLGGAVASGASISSPSEQPKCEIRTQPVQGGLQFEGAVRGAQGQSGRYAVAIERSGPGGTSELSQDGDFAIPRSGSVAVSSTELSVSAADAYRVRMTVWSDTGQTSCEARSASLRTGKAGKEGQS